VKLTLLGLVAILTAVILMIFVCGNREFHKPLGDVNFDSGGDSE
jgi:hypothetical protein